MDTAVTRRRAVIKRYADSYLIARATVAFGKVIKVVGAIFAFCIFGISLLLLLGSAKSLINTGGVGGATAAVAIFASALWSALVWFVFALFGTVVSALGQNLLASLDEAVHTSPFLTDEDRAQAMSLPRLPEGVRPASDVDPTLFCANCGTKAQAGATSCSSCGARL